MNSPLRSPESILIVKPGSLGDVVHALPCVAALRREWPKAELRWILDTRWEGLVRGSGLVDTIIPFPRQEFRGLRGALRSLGWFAALHAWQSDLCLDLQGLLRSGLMARASGSPRILGLSDAREGARSFFHQTVEVRPEWHAVDRYLAVLGALEISRDPLEFPLPLGSQPAEWNLREFVVLHPFARGEGKSLSEAVIREFCAAWNGPPLVLVGMGKVPAALPTSVHDWTGKTSLEELTWILRRARSVVSVDSGPMHMAAAVNPRLLGIHTWSDPRRVGPYSETASIWQGGEIRRQDLAAPTILPPQNPGPEDGRKMAVWAQTMG